MAILVQEGLNYLFSRLRCDDAVHDDADDDYDDGVDAVDDDVDDDVGTKRAVGQDKESSSTRGIR